MRLLPIPEFQRQTLEALRQLLESGRAVVARQSARDIAA
jgi:predicted ATPase with chaperone activity